MTRPSVRILLKQREDSFTVAERRVVAVLLANYPSAALTSISQLAGAAGVSDPTVHRLVLKLGFEGYPEFQRALLTEVDARMNSPLSRLESSADEPHTEDTQQAMLGSMTLAIGKTAEMASREDFERTVSLLADQQRTVLCCGGRASEFIASWLARLLSQLRPRARHVEPSLERGSEALADLAPGDVLVVYDYRRYQESVVQFARVARELGAHVVLFTDEWRSPIASFADAVLVSFGQAASPFDTKVPVLAQTEALIAALVQRAPDEAKARLKRIEALRAGRVAEDA
ncbi:MurR/RpiR family transcriptional regulator [Trinickia dinghuensis]|uniref:MurR/RpiR family transcriptional regulator n=1 Tax=Trinickia dinghuensis TaxID=2291023 RepID=UPI0015F145F3|nr:MurR/RpiR family transcriptional regulator [Trinickia dinghuensis]